MAPPTNYKINPDELFAHARAVAQLQQPLDRVVYATKAAAPNGISVAYGLMCQSFALTLLPVREYAEDAVEKISRSVDSASNQLLKAVDTYVKSDERSSGQLRKIGENLANPDSKLIAENTKWDWKNYNPADGGPMTQMDKENWAKGGGIVGNCWDMVVEVREKGKRNYGAMVGHIASMGADGAALAGDPIASIVGWAASWMMEHIKPFKLILDGLAGNPEMIKGASVTWQNVQKELERLANHYMLAVKHGAGGWDGEAGDSYRQNAAQHIIDAMKAAANLAEVLSIIVGTTGELVNLVRSAVRDLTAQAIGALASAAAQRFLAYKPPFEILLQTRNLLQSAKSIVKFLIVFVSEFGTQVGLVIEAFKTVANIIPKLDGV